MAGQYTCITCRVLFHDPELQREHYKCDWHRYNLKRKVAGLQPVTNEEFEDRVNQHRAMAADETPDKTQYCKCCSKSFSTKNAYENHLNSKKHKQAVERTEEREDIKKDTDDAKMSDSDSFVKIEDIGNLEAKENESEGKFVILNAGSSEPDEEYVDTDSDVEEIDSDDWEEYHVKGQESLIKPSNCLFCEHHSRTILKNLKHMSKEHSFFIPDIEFCVDIKGLLLYLGEKISQGYMCLWCNEKGRTFYSMEAARSHMIDKGHCKMLHEGLALAEYSDYYDYSTSYPEQEVDKNEADVEMEEEVDAPTALNEEDYQLVLPSGAVVGHRSLMRYYKQNLSTNSTALVKKSDRRLHRVLGQYRALGWAPQEEEAASKRARDIHYMKRLQAKLSTKLQFKANKFQKHYRPQVNF